MFTSAAFYDVDPASSAAARALQERVMPHLHAALSRVYQAAPISSSAAATPVFTLTPAERAIVDLLLQGRTNKEIGKQLRKSDETVKRQLAMLMRRIGARNRVELVNLINGVHGPSHANNRVA
ncbi:MAG: helix-turn-helix transcriptional regulator [Variovorax sp.]